MGSRTRNTTPGGAARCRIILGALAGQDNVAIAAGLAVSRPTVRRWRQRVREQGIGEGWQIARIHASPQEEEERMIVR